MPLARRRRRCPACHALGAHRADCVALGAPVPPEAEPTPDPDKPEPMHPPVTVTTDKLVAVFLSGMASGVASFLHNMQGAEFDDVFGFADEVADRVNCDPIARAQLADELYRFALGKPVPERSTVRVMPRPRLHGTEGE